MAKFSQSASNCCCSAVVFVVAVPRVQRAHGIDDRAHTSHPRTAIDTNANKALDGTFPAAVRLAESVRLSANPSKAQLVNQKNILERVNLRDGG